MPSPADSPLTSSTSQPSTNAESSSSASATVTSSDKENQPPGASLEESSSTDMAEVETVNPLDGCWMEDVLILDVEKNSISVNRKKTLSKLHSINDILVAKIEIKDLKVFCTRVGIKGQGQKSKKMEYDVIVTEKVDPTFVQTKDNLIDVEDSESAPATT